VVLIDPELLRTLPDREFRAGLYEALKCGIIGDLDLFLRFEQKRAQILKRDPVELEGVIAQSVKLKAEVVSADEHEGGLRRVLNLGHTIGHASRRKTGYRSLLHGEAVAWGIVAATNIALTVGRTDSVTAGRIADAVLGLGRLPELRVSPRKILARLQADKKTQSGVVHFVLPREIGKVEIAADVPDNVVVSAVEELRRLSRGGWGSRKHFRFSTSHSRLKIGARHQRVFQLAIQSCQIGGRTLMPESYRPSIIGAAPEGRNGCRLCCAGCPRDVLPQSPRATIS